jgi:hypothetical protein
VPTDPLESIIYRDLAKANAKPLIDIAIPVLHELVNFASNAIVRCSTSSSANKNEDLAILSLFRHVMEMTDGIEELLAESCVMPAIPLLRSSFEALISIEYITNDPSIYVMRSLAWLVDYMHQRIAMYERLNPSTGKGKEFQESIKKDQSVQTLALPPASEVSKVTSNLTSLLSDPQFFRINSDFLGLKGAKKWFRLYGGPENLRELSHFVGRAALYDFMYRYWSRVTHAQDFSPFITKSSSGHGTIRPIRDPTEMKNVANFAATVMLASIRALIGWFRPDENIKPWYLKEVRPGYVKLFTKT